MSVSSRRSDWLGHFYENKKRRPASKLARTPLSWSRSLGKHRLHRWRRCLMSVERDYAVVVPTGSKVRIYCSAGWLSESGRDLLHRIKACCPVMERGGGGCGVTGKPLSRASFAPTADPLWQQILCGSKTSCGSKSSVAAKPPVEANPLWQQNLLWKQILCGSKTSCGSKSSVAAKPPMEADSCGSKACSRWERPDLSYETPGTTAQHSPPTTPVPTSAKPSAALFPATAWA